MLVRTIQFDISLAESTPGAGLIFLQLNANRWPAPEGDAQWYLDGIDHGIDQFDTLSTRLEPGDYWLDAEKIVWNDPDDVLEPGVRQHAQLASVNVTMDQGQVIGVQWQ